MSSYTEIPFKWEVIEQGRWEKTLRVSVYGGWLVRHMDCEETTNGVPKQKTSSMVFISDPKHSWEVK